VAVVARQLGRPARWTETRTDNMLAMAHGRGQVQYAKLGGTRDGKILGLPAALCAGRAAAHPGIGCMLPNLTKLMASGVYEIPTIAYDRSGVATNTTPVGAFRGAGRPEAAAAIERIVDVFADELGMDPVEVRRRNFSRPTPSVQTVTVPRPTAARTSRPWTWPWHASGYEACAPSSSAAGPPAIGRRWASASPPTWR